MSPRFNHLVEIDSSRRLLVIHRVFEDGSRSLFTQVELPNKDQLDEFCRTLGENLLTDSPDARKLLNL